MYLLLSSLLDCDFRDEALCFVGQSLYLFEMKAALVVLAGIGALADPPQPVFPEPQHYQTDWTLFNYTDPRRPTTFEGDGRLQRDVASQQFSDMMRVYEGHTHHPDEHHTVGHWTNEKTIWRVEFLPQNKTQCFTSQTGGVMMPDPWAWVKNSKYQGTQHHHGQDVDVWGWNDTDKPNHYELAVATNAPNVPLWTAVETYDSKGMLQYRFEERISGFSTTINSTFFQKPAQCP